MALTRRGCMQGLAGLGCAATTALEPLGSPLFRAALAIASFADRAHGLAGRVGTRGPASAAGMAGEAHAAGEIIPAVTPASAPLLPSHLRAARRLLGWSEEETAQASGLSRATLRALERPATGTRSPFAVGEDGERGARDCQARRLRAAFEAAGVVFVGSALDGPGVQFAAGTSFREAQSGQEDR